MPPPTPYEDLAATMQDEQLKRAVGRRIKTLRKQKGWTQKELAEQIGVRFGQLNKYEGGLHAPPLEKMLKLAELFGTTVDYILTGDQELDHAPLHNLRLLERFRALQDFEREDQDAVIKLIDAMIIKRKVEGAVKPIDVMQG